MLKIKKHGILLRRTKLKFENFAVFNPGILQDGNTVHMIYRAIDKKYKSCLGYARLDGPDKIVERWKKPFMYPKYKYEKFGIEDARLTRINKKIYMTYVVHDGKNALTALAQGDSLFKLKKFGIISPRLTYNKVGKLFGYTKLKDDYYTFESYYKDKVAKNVMVWDKDVMLFPEKIKNQYMLIHRILPDIQIAPAKHLYFYKTKEYWERHIMRLAKFVILEPRQGWETRHVGGGAPPVKTDKGWLLIYHGVEPRNKGRIYHAGAALLDLKNPFKVIARLPKPLFSPTESYEKSHFVNNVVFPTGTALFGDELYIYYGASDSYIALASVSLKELLKELMKNKIKQR